MMALNRTLVDAEETTVANHVFGKKCGENNSYVRNCRLFKNRPLNEAMACDYGILSKIHNGDIGRLHPFSKAFIFITPQNQLPYF